MYEYELSQFRSADLIRRAEHERQAREAVLSRRAARREAAARAADGEAHTGRPRRHRFPRTA
ncbi:hypothetical protein [Streptomyces resistomycificus]|uniref:Uncharacterized protein n=1 Tax=Streptomyces resistomycificus TaxID=67356 RepID=A0A0L8L9A1_9ACTN|nr:hypothetical protein [Streptomyces resistomycificus]KOG34689.1 hypothetical protein ADK37_17880 [Streptomyces resistomycificus]KUN93352.1 hypothetical protein AQJ84_30195 [Streptomyces resistomycificus]